MADENVSLMNFGQAIERLKNGMHLQRAGWNGKGMYVYLVYADERTSYDPYLVLFTAQKTHQAGWNASTPDVLAEDWQEITD